MECKGLVWSSLLICLCLVSPLYGKTSEFKEIAKQRYDKETWHTYRHESSGLEVIWIENKDVNKSLTVGVKTPTTNNTGVNHIIEHTIFTGSSAYPSSSVFFDANEAYPNTYMNALTSGDMTIFPFSTPYLSCYNHLRDIYLDAIFKPAFLEQPYGFYEEGFHAVPQEKRCGGVVYNEMKGAYSNVDRGIYRAIRQFIYAESHYAYDSGGAPNAIPTLTYEDFVETYKRYYYPGNMKIIVYGDVPIGETLEHILPYVQGQNKKEGIDLCVKQINPNRKAEFAILPSQDKGCIVKAFVLNQQVSANELQQLDLWISTYLMSPQAYFQKALLSLGAHAKWLKDDDVPYPIYTVAITDLPIDQLDMYSKILDRLFQEVPKHLQKNVFLEQDVIKEAKWLWDKQESSNNRGILIAQSILDGWAHYREEQQYYLVKDQLNKMKQLNPSISDLLLKDAACYTMKLLPGVNEIENPEELSAVDSKCWETLYEQIKLWQQPKGTLEPVELDDLLLDYDIIPHITKRAHHWEIETKVDTELARSQLYLNTSHISQKDLPYLFLYSYLLEESAKDISPFSGVVTTKCSAYPLSEGYWPCFKVSIITPKSETEHGILLQQARSYLLNRTQEWYKQKLVEFILEMRNELQNNAISTLSCMTRGSGDERGAYLYQQSYPLYDFCVTLARSQKSSWMDGIRKMDQELFHIGGTILATTVPQGRDNQVAKKWKIVLESLPMQPNLKGNYSFDVPEGTYVIYQEAPIDHCFVSLHKPEGINGTDYLVAAYLTKNYLNPKLRVKMGAYGAGCQIYDLETMGIYTYRDPDYHSSLPIIEKSAEPLSHIEDSALILSKAEALSKVHGQYRLLASPIEQCAAMEHIILGGKTPKWVVGLQKEIIFSTADSIEKNQKTYEKMLDKGKTAIMTKKNYTLGQNFTTYHY